MGWGWDVALRLFKKIEDWHGPKSDLRGIGGPLYVAPPVDPNPIAGAFVESGRAVGSPVIEDNNGTEMEGTSFFNLTIKDGKRNSVASAYLRPAIQRPNLTVVTRAETDRLVLEGSRYVGCDGARLNGTGWSRVIAHPRPPQFKLAQVRIPPRGTFSYFHAVH